MAVEVKHAKTITLTYWETIRSGEDRESSLAEWHATCGDKHAQAITKEGAIFILIKMIGVEEETK